MLVWRKGNIEKNCLCLNSIAYCYNGAQRYEQFLQVGRLYRALILLGLALCLLSAAVSSVRSSCCCIDIHFYVYFYLTLYLLVSCAWWSASLGSRPRLARPLCRVTITIQYNLLYCSSVCFEIKFSVRHRGFDGVLFNLWPLGLETLNISRCLNYW